MKTLVIIPAHNEEESILKTIENLKKIINSQKKYKIKYVVVNDGSTDDTKKILRDNKIPHINHIVNMGVGTAMKSGIIYSMEKDIDNITQFDGDGQHNAEYIFDLIKGIEEGFDIVIGSRFLTNKKHTSIRMLGSKILSMLIYIKSGFKQRITDPTSGQRILSKNVKEVYLNDASSSEPSFVIKYFKKDYKIKEVQVEMNERQAGESHFNVMNSIKFMLEQSLAIVFGY